MLPRGDGQATLDAGRRASVRALEWTNFFLADVQAGLGPLAAAYLAGMGWQSGAVGRALTFGGIVTVVLQTPAGGLVDRVSWKRMILVLGSVVLGFGALLLAFSAAPPVVYTAQALIGLASPFLGPSCFGRPPSLRPRRTTLPCIHS